MIVLYAFLKDNYQRGTKRASIPCTDILSCHRTAKRNYNIQSDGFIATQGSKELTYFHIFIHESLPPIHVSVHLSQKQFLNVQFILIVFISIFSFVFL